MEPEVMFPLYPPNGGPARGFMCNADGKCKDVTRTKRGMWAHLRVVHGIVKQAELEFEPRIDREVAKDIYSEGLTVGIELGKKIGAA